MQVIYKYNICRKKHIYLHIQRVFYLKIKSFFTVALVDCIWVADELRCITQEGFECKKPVSEVAEISVPARFVNQSGTYRCIPDGYSTNIQPCQFYQTKNEKTKEMFPQTKGKFQLLHLT